MTREEWDVLKANTKTARWHARRGGRFIAGPFSPPTSGKTLQSGRRGSFYGQTMSPPRRRK